MNDSLVSQFKLNLPTDLKNRLGEAATRSGRSLSSEIITRLQASLSLADDNGLEFTYEALEGMMVEVAERELEPMRQRLLVLEMLARGDDPFNDDK